MQTTIALRYAGHRVRFHVADGVVLGGEATVGRSEVLLRLCPVTRHLISNGEESTAVVSPSVEASERRYATVKLITSTRRSATAANAIGLGHSTAANRVTLKERASRCGAGNGVSTDFVSPTTIRSLTVTTVAASID